MAAIEQAIHVKGQVVDSTGEPVIGANIVVKGTNTGVISDIDGNFAIDAPKIRFCLSLLSDTNHRK